MDGYVDTAGKQRLLDLLDEDPARADLAERSLAIAIAGGGDRDKRHFDARAAQPHCRQLGLRQGELRAA